MNTTTAIIRQNTEIETARPSVLQLAAQLPAMREMAEVYLKAKIVNPQLKSEHEVLAVMFKAHELGIATTYGLEKMSVINGHINMEAELMLALIYGSGVCAAVDIREATNQCTVTMTRTFPKIKHSATFSRDDAMKAGLLSKDNWQKYPKAMLLWRAITICAKVVFPDILGGMLPNSTLSVRVGTPPVLPSETMTDETAPSEPRSDEATDNPPQLPANKEEPAPSDNSEENKMKRPYHPSVLKDNLREYAATHKQGNLDTLRTELAGFWELCINATDTETASFLRQVFGKSYIEYLSEGECNAILRWLNPQSETNGDIKTSKHLQTEFQAFIRVQGNEKLFPATSADNATINNAISQ